jgi:hypothetical protein
MSRPAELHAPAGRGLALLALRPLSAALYIRRKLMPKGHSEGRSGKTARSVYGVSAEGHPDGLSAADLAQSRNRSDTTLDLLHHTLQAVMARPIAICSDFGCLDVPAPGAAPADTRARHAAPNPCSSAGAPIRLRLANPSARRKR